MDTICNQHAEVIVQRFNDALPEEATLMGHIFERIAIDVVCSGVAKAADYALLSDSVCLSPRELALVTPGGLTMADVNPSVGHSMS